MRKCEGEKSDAIFKMHFTMKVSDQITYVQHSKNTATENKPNDVITPR